MLIGFDLHELELHRDLEGQKLLFWIVNVLYFQRNCMHRIIAVKTKHNH